MNTPLEILRSRKPARTTGLVPPEVREGLNTGVLESKNLCEWLVVDQPRLAQAVLPEAGLGGLLPAVLEAFAAPRKPAAPKLIRAAGTVLAEALDSGPAFDAASEVLGRHPSDLVRAWACEMTGQRRGLSLEGKLSRLKPLAADPHTGVREAAWMAVRNHLIEELDTALRLLRPWVEDEDFRVRRFASEATRPRGVWCRHIEALKTDPGPGLALLDPLHADPEKYVRDSVANWLNDAAKSQPEAVRECCADWIRRSAAKGTASLVRRALRTIGS